MIPILDIYEDGSLAKEAPLYQKLEYDLSNLKVLARADGCFNISKYAVANRFEVWEPDSFYTGISIQNQPVSALASKEVNMIGHMQKIKMQHAEVEITCEIFLDDTTQAVFQQYTFTSISIKEESIFSRNSDQNIPFEQGMPETKQETMPETTPINIRIDFGYLYGMEGEVAVIPMPWGFKNSISDGKNASVAECELVCSHQLIHRETEGSGVHYSALATLYPEQTTVLKFVYHLVDGERKVDTCGAEWIAVFQQAYENTQEYCDFLRTEGKKNVPENNLVKRGMYIACLNCGISSYKEIDDFKGFFAGIHYQRPARTYYRDGYFTVLPLLPYKPEWVRNEILMLANGIGVDGACPSAVLSKDAVFWPDHKDSPAFFVLMVHDYLKITGDISILEEKVKEKSILDAVLFLTDNFLNSADKNGLLYRESNNRHDWADNVYREGYITYIEALFYRMVFCTGAILERVSGMDGGLYYHAAERIKEAINQHLWMDEKGYYSNYRSENYLEDNLSIDTVLTVWFGIAEADRAKSVLKNMEKMLESRNNTQQPFGTWGTMCCYPFYSNKAHLVEKSNYDFVYHNGSDWPYLSCLYAYVKELNGLDGDAPLLDWFQYSLEKEWCTPIEYFNPITGKGSYLQGWSAMGAMAVYFANREEKL